MAGRVPAIHAAPQEWNPGRRSRAEPRIGKRGQPHGSGLGKHRWPVERANAWLLENKRLDLRYDRLGHIVEALLQAACILLVAPRLSREF